MKTLRSTLLATTVAAVSAALVGCGTGSPNITGRVISGPSAVVISADPKDPRMSQAGIAATNIVVRKYAGEGSTGPIVASGVSTEKGEFRVPLSDLDAQKFELVLTATTPDKRVSRGRFFMNAGKPILVIVRDAQ